MQNNLNPIQNDILTILMQSPIGKKYARLRANGLDNDLHNYHLQELVKKGYVNKNRGLYELTEKGNLYISKLNAQGEKEDFFKISVALTVFRNDYQEILTQERTRRPFLGDITTVAGKVRKGEMIIDTAKRKLKEETGLETDFKFIGVIRKIKRNKEGVILEDTFYHCCVATDPTGELVTENEHGKNSWLPAKELAEKEKQNIDIGEYDMQIRKRFINKDFSSFYFEQDMIVRDY